MEEFDKAREYLVKSMDLGRARSEGYYDLAGIECFLGNTAKAKEHLHQYDGKNWPGATPYFIQVDPMFKSLRGDHELEEMVKNAQEDKAKIRERIRKLEAGL